MNDLRLVVALGAALSLFVGCGPSAPPATAHGACEHCERNGHCDQCEHCKAGGCEHCEHCRHGEGHEHGEHHEGEGHEHGEHHEDVPGPLHDLHETLAPVWHADKGPARTQRACDDAKKLADQAAAVAAMAKPDAAKGDAAAWKADAAALVDTTKGLEAACAKDGRPDVDAQLGAVHEAFHKLVDRFEHGHP
jgi:hypothetical protein